jgi:4-alpha-glucanotransferase
MSESTFLSSRTSGVLLHPTSLPGPDGIGDLGPGAYRFIEWLEEHGQSLWQILPLGPTSFGDSPYQTLSAMAGNPLLINLEELAGKEWLTPDFVAKRPRFDGDRVDFGPVIQWKNKCLDQAYEGFKARGSAQDRAEFAAWRRAQETWLTDFVMFMALKEDQGGRPWCEWPAGLRDRRTAELLEAADRLQDRITAHAFRQWVFFFQWTRLKAYAQSRGIRLVGDLPIFVAYDSSDVWAQRKLFHLDSKGHPLCVAGVPPDYFSATGQLWGNPLYDWKKLKSEGYSWWIDRLRACLETVDVVRIDHFRGFAAYWEVPAGQKTAMKGRWVKGPGADFFEALQQAFGPDLPIIAEDLGVITADVEQLRDQFNLPGMKVLQFAWGGPENAFLPHNHIPNSVVYAGTHDNDPTVSWWNNLLDDDTRQLISEYLDREIMEPHWTLIRMGLNSCAHTFIATMQDILGLGREGRMNLPGEGSGNWNWRMPESALTGPGGARLARLTWLANRKPGQAKPTGVDPDYQPETPA